MLFSEKVLIGVLIFILRGFGKLESLIMLTFQNRFFERSTKTALYALHYSLNTYYLVDKTGCSSLVFLFAIETQRVEVDDD